MRKRKNANAFFRIWQSSFEFAVRLLLLPVWCCLPFPDPGKNIPHKRIFVFQIVTIICGNRAVQIRQICLRRERKFNFDIKMEAVRGTFAVMLFSAIGINAAGAMSSH